MRESYAQNQIPTSGVTDVPYPSYHEAVQGIGKHGVECFIGKVTGAGGVGGSLLHVPFQPAVVKAINPAGATPAIWDSVFATSGAIHVVTILAVAASATPPVLTKVANNDWTVALPTAMAPNAEVLTVICWGVRDVSGGE